MFETKMGRKKLQMEEKIPCCNFVRERCGKRYRGLKGAIY